MDFLICTFSSVLFSDFNKKVTFYNDIFALKKITVISHKELLYHLFSHLFSENNMK